MRIIPVFTACLLAAAPLASFAPAAHADSNDFMGQAQRFLNNGSNNDNRDAYERGREDEMRRQQAERSRDHVRRDNDRDRDWTRDEGYREQSNNGYNYR